MPENDRIASKITTVRESLGLSAAELAERSGCEPEVIERLEAGELAPSLAPLIKITRALGMRLGTLLDDDTGVGPVVTRKDAAEEVARLKSLETSSDAGVLSFFSLATGKSTRHMEPFIITVDPGRVAERSLSSHEGEEFIYVLEGAVEIEYGKSSYVIEDGDSIYYDSIVPHEVRAAGDLPARILAVVYAPL